MKVLFIDDEEMRHIMIESVSDGTGGIELFKAYTIDDALEMLNNEQYDLVCIDHDLCEENRNGTVIAKKIRDDEISIPYIWVHSANPAGAMNIAAILSRANGVEALVREPFNFIALQKVLDYVKSELDKVETGNDQ